MSRNSIAKALKGPGVLSARLTGALEDSIFAAISGGGIVFDNVEITSGTIDGVVLGNNNPGPAIFTTIQSGNPSGQGYQVCFYGQAVGDSACWEPVIGRWNIQGDLLVRDITDLGNLRVSVNTLSSTNLNGNIIIDPNGTGSINLLGPVSQSSTTGNVAFAPVVGNFTVNAGNIVSTNSVTDTFFRTSNGDITLETGSNITSKNINLITTGSTPTITTTSPHGLAVGDTITLSGTNSSPNINGDQIVTDVLSTTTFRISPGFSVLTLGTSGSFIQHNDIYLNATNNVNIPTNTKLVFGSDDNTYIKANSGNELLINTVDDIYLTPGTNKDVKIPDNIGLIFGSDLTRKIESDGTDLHIYPGTGTFIVDGNIKINGTSTIVESTVTVIKDPVITLGGNTAPIIDDNKDRGIEFRYHNGTTSKLGFFGFDDSTGCFTIIPDATNVGEVFSGAPGCINVGGISATSLNLQGGRM